MIQHEDPIVASDYRLIQQKQAESLRPTLNRRVVRRFLHHAWQKGREWLENLFGPSQADRPFDLGLN